MKRKKIEGKPVLYVRDFWKKSDYKCNKGFIEQIRTKTGFEEAWMPLNWNQTNRRSTDYVSNWQKYPEHFSFFNLNFCRDFNASVFVFFDWYRFLKFFQPTNHCWIKKWNSDWKSFHIVHFSLLFLCLSYMIGNLHLSFWPTELSVGHDL